MNIPILIAAVTVLICFLAHTFVGNVEAMSTRPGAADIPPSPEAERIERNWVQSMCAFQLVTVDLLAWSVLLFVLGGTNLIPARREVALVAALFFALWAAAWLIQLAVLRRGRGDYLRLGQWIAWCLCAGLLYAGSLAPA